MGHDQKILYGRNETSQGSGRATNSAYSDDCGGYCLGPTGNSGESSRSALLELNHLASRVVCYSVHDKHTNSTLVVVCYSMHDKLS